MCRSMRSRAGARAEPETAVAPPPSRCQTVVPIGVSSAPRPMNLGASSAWTARATVTKSCATKERQFCSCTLREFATPTGSCRSTSTDSYARSGARGDRLIGSPGRRAAGLGATAIVDIALRSRSRQNRRHSFPAPGAAGDWYTALAEQNARRAASRERVRRGGSRSGHDYRRAHPVLPCGVNAKSNTRASRADGR